VQKLVTVEFGTPDEHHCVRVKLRAFAQILFVGVRPTTSGDALSTFTANRRVVSALIDTDWPEQEIELAIYEENTEVPVYQLDSVTDLVHRGTYAFHGRLYHAFTRELRKDQ
jgi:hypothetical protein